MSWSFSTFSVILVCLFTEWNKVFTGEKCSAFKIHLYLEIIIWLLKTTYKISRVRNFSYLLHVHVAVLIIYIFYFSIHGCWNFSTNISILTTAAFGQGKHEVICKYFCNLITALTNSYFKIKLLFHLRHFNKNSEHILKPKLLFLTFFPCPICSYFAFVLYIILWGWNCLLP